MNALEARVMMKNGPTDVYVTGPKLQGTSLRAR
jgi:hypothetical protein